MPLLDLVEWLDWGGVELRQGDWSIEVWADQIEVTSSLPQPDPNWRHTDTNGHEHWHKSDTLLWVIDEEWIDEDNYEASSGHYECRQCGEHIVPGLIGPSPFREYISGMTYAEATHSDGRRVDLSAEQIDQLRSAASIEDVLGP